MDQHQERIRIGDAERDDVVNELREHAEAGRLTSEEFNERMEAALSSRYRDELPPLLADLPRAATDDERSASPTWRERRWRRPPFVLPLVLVALVGSGAAIAHGHFPWPLLWLAVLACWFRPWAMRRFRMPRA